MTEAVGDYLPSLSDFSVVLAGVLSYLSGFVLLAAGLLGAFMLLRLHQSTRYDFERDWSVLARRRIFRLPGTGGEVAASPAPAEPGLPGTVGAPPTEPDDSPNKSGPTDVAAALSIMLDEHEEIQRLIFRPSPVRSLLGPRNPQQRRQFWQQRFKARQERSRLVAHMLERSVPAFNNFRQRERWRPTLLVGLELKSRALCHADLRGCVVLRADLRDADLRGVRFVGAVLHDVHFDNALMDDASLRFLRSSGNASLHGLDSVEAWDVTEDLVEESVH